MINEPVSTINSIITKQYLEKQLENQYFERKGLGEKDMKPTKIAEELIGMLNADGGVLAFGVSDKGEIQNKVKSEKRKVKNSLHFSLFMSFSQYFLFGTVFDGKKAYK